jgi:transcriptional regulator with AAA-type ATPase domain
MSMMVPYTDYRIVFLRDKGKNGEEQAPLHKDYTYYEPWNKLEHEAPLTKIINKCKKDKEWGKVVDKTEKDYPQESKTEYIKPVRNSTPEAFLAAPEDLKKKIPDYIFRTLVWEAEKIARRLTIFILPTVTVDELVENQDVVDSIAEDVDRYFEKNMDEENFHIPFSFAIESRNYSQGAVNLIDGLVDRLLLTTNKGSFDVLKNHLFKEGPVLLEGPTGVGKTMFSRLFAKEYAKKNPEGSASKSMNRKQKDIFHHMNVSGIPADLVESRIRGTEKGYATDVVERPGWFEIADNGVLFLDEFQSAPLWVQNQLLDIVDPLSNKIALSRLGNDKRKLYNVKLFIAVNEPVKSLIDSNRLRRDLYYRIRQTLSVPSLKELLSSTNKIRGGLSAKRFIWKLIYIYRWKHPAIIDAESLYKPFPSFPAELIESFLKETWEGNFRQFEKKIADILWEWDNSIEKIDLSSFIEDNNQNSELLPSLGTDASNDQKILRTVERALKNNDYVCKKACTELKIYRIGSYPTLRRYIRKNYDRFSAETQNNHRVKRVAQQKTP